MSTVIEQLNHVILGARKRGNIKMLSIYTTFKGDLIRKFGKEPTWDEAAAHSKAVIKSYEVAKDEALKVGQIFNTDPEEIEFLCEFIPQQMSENEIRAFFANSGIINKGLLMKAIKEEYPNQYNGKLAAKVAGEFNKTDKVN